MTERTSQTDVRVGVVGVSGYTGVELLRILHGHPALKVTRVAAGRSAGTALTDSWPALTGLYDGVTIEAFDAERMAADCDAVFCALPHGLSDTVVPPMLDAGVVVVDLAADYRLSERAVYGLVEKNRAALVGARLIANPGCYPTATALAALPMVEAGATWVVSYCLSGFSGAGRKASSTRHLLSEGAASAGPYAVGGVHRHVPEMEATLGIPVVFTPHLVPMVRGMIATVHARLDTGEDTAALQKRYRERYADDPMVVIRHEPPATGDVLGTNRAHIYCAVDSTRGVHTAICAIDNLVKGASGQAVQALNVALSLDESLGLPVFPLLP